MVKLTREILLFSVSTEWQDPRGKNKFLESGQQLKLHMDFFLKVKQEAVKSLV